MPRIVQLSEFKRRGAGMFVRDLGNEYLVVANEKNPKSSFVVMGLESFINFISPFKTQDSVDLEAIHQTIKAKISEEMSKRKRKVENV